MEAVTQKEAEEILAVPASEPVPVTKTLEDVLAASERNAVDESFQEVTESANILVKNIAPSPNPEVTTLTALGDLFSFCGNITSMSTIPDESDGSSVSAIITFENSTAAGTALLLNHTVLHSKPITVELAPLNLAAPGSVSPLNFPGQPGDVNQIIAPPGIFAQVAQKASEVDEQYKISVQMNQMAKTIEASVLTVDQQYQISDKINGVVGQVNAFDEQYQISTQVNQAVTTASAQVNAIDQQYQISTSVSQAVTNASDQVIALNNQYQVTEQVAAAAEKASVEGTRLITTVSQELQLEQRAKEASEAISLGAASVAEFLQTNETAKDVVSGVQEVGTYLSNFLGNAFTSLASSAPDNKEPNIVIVDTRL